MSGYTPNKWIDREGLTRYFETVDDDGALIFTPDYTQVTEIGTPVNADNMNHIEDGIAAVSFSKYDPMTTYAKGDLVTAVVENKLKIYKSLQDNNKGNPLTDVAFWEEVEFSGGGGGTGLQLFDLIEKDHILTYEESKGLALLGTYVYKEAVAGSRYGYPDFYNRVIAEKEAATATETTLGDSTVTMYVNPNGHVFYDIADKDVVDVFYQTYGVAWYYGVDSENERVFLPRNDWFFQNGSTADVGKFNEASLPNIKTTNYVYSGSTNMPDAFTRDGGCVYSEKLGNVGTGGGTGTDMAIGINLDASLSSSVYKDDTDTVQPPSVNLITYMVVGNTESTSAIIDVTDVTTTENDTIPLFTSMYFDFTPNNVSWIKAGEQTNSGGIYEFAYNELVNELTTPKYGLKVIETANMVDGVDYSLFWQVDQTNMTFNTPIRTEERVLVSKKEATDDDTSWYNLYSDGWLEQGGIITVSGNTGKTVNLLKNYANTEYTVVATKNSNSNQNNAASWNIQSKTVSSFVYAQGDTGGLGCNWMACGYAEIPVASDYTENTNLYFKVANAVQNLELINAGEVLEAVNNVVPNNSELIASYGIPDYSAITTFTYNTSILATYDCYVFTVGGTGNKDYGFYLEISEDNVTWTYIFKSICGYAYSYPTSVTGFVPKGYYYRVTPVSTASTAPSCYVCPLKGANR